MIIESKTDTICDIVQQIVNIQKWFMEILIIKFSQCLQSIPEKLPVSDMAKLTSRKVL